MKDITELHGWDEFAEALITFVTNNETDITEHGPAHVMIGLGEFAVRAEIEIVPRPG